jgi:putative glutamine amidotransferase
MSRDAAGSSRAGAVLVSAVSADYAVPYVAALEAAGVPGEAIRVVTPEDSDVAALAAAAAGLVLCGGVDVEPWRYGEEPLPAAGLELLPALDALDWELLAGARAGRTPVWGICRGFQVINVFLGGSLWQDLPLQRPGAAAHDCGPPDDLLAHPARALAADAPLGARLAAAGGGMPRVNSRHHQAVKRLAPGLLAVADSPDDGLIEAAVLAADAPAARRARPATGAGANGRGGEWWVRGVQWHPEDLLALPEQMDLWRDFVAALVLPAPAVGRPDASRAAAPGQVDDGAAAAR